LTARIILPAETTTPQRTLPVPDIVSEYKGKANFDSG